MEPSNLVQFPAQQARFSEADVLSTWRFLAIADRGVAEVRIIGKRGVSIGYFDNEASFLSACETANGTANIYVGIQPRPFHFLDLAPNVVKPIQHGAKDTDIEWLSSLVLDIDPVREKDTASTTEELDLAIKAASRVADHIASHGFLRPLVHVSGNGAHLWIALPPSQVIDDNRAEITGRLKAFETRIRHLAMTPETDGKLKVDSIYNLSRIIKVIGTLSVKGPDLKTRPHRVSRSLSEFQRREDPALLDALLAWPIETDRRAGTVMTNLVAPWSSFKAGSGLSPAVHALISSNNPIRKLFEGKGKLPLGVDGKPLDQSSSGYDFSLALALARKGITDKTELCNALWFRPDGCAQEKGARHCWRTVEAALKACEQQSKVKTNLHAVTSAAPEEHADLDFTVERVVIKKAMPPVYEFTIDGNQITLTAEDILSPRAFSLRFIEHLHKIPQMPGKRSPVSWREHVNMWLASAEVVDLGRDGRDDADMEDTIKYVIDSLPEASCLDDLDGARILYCDEGRAFRKRPIFWALREKFPAFSARSGMVCSALRAIGCINKVLSFEGTVRRVWIAPEKWTRND